jgi:hypothetical protein
VDAEQPFGVSRVTYSAVLTDVVGTQWTIASSSITSTVTSDVVSDADPRRRRSRENRVAAGVETGPRRHPVQRQRADRRRRQTPIIPLRRRITVRTETDSDGDTLNDLLDEATEGTILVRKAERRCPVSTAPTRCSTTPSRPTGTTTYRWFTLDVVKAEAWPDTMEAAGFTLQDIANNYSALSDISAAFATLLAIALYDFG